MRILATLAVLTLSLSGFAVVTPTLAVDTSISDKCGPDGPEAYKRPGGYCEQIGANGSISDSGDESCGIYCIIDDGDGPEDQ